MRAFAVLVLAGVLLAGCSAIAEPKVRRALVRSGMSDENADCMAGRMVDRLSIGQLRKLEALQPPERGRRTLGDYVSIVRRVGDPELIVVTTSSAALCTTGLAR